MDQRQKTVGDAMTEITWMVRYGGTPNTDDRGYLSARAVIKGVTYNFQCDVDGQRPRNINRLGSTGKWRRVTFSVVPRIAREIEPAMIEYCKRKAPEEGEISASDAAARAAATAAALNWRRRCDEPTQAQIKAAERAIDKEWCEWQRTHTDTIFSNVLLEKMAKAALIAAAEAMDLGGKNADH
jgi:hypothetical protein